MKAERKGFLERRLREASRQQPGLVVLRGLLLGLGGIELVPPPGREAVLPRLIDDGFVMAGPVVRRAMKTSACHRNVAGIWASKGCEIVGIGTGYSLSDDGLWRQHSWGVLREGILETTALRVKYFGVLLQREEADMFATANLVGTRASRGSGMGTQRRRQEANP